MVIYDVDEYQREAGRTINTELTRREILKHGLYGLASETGEVLGLFQKELQGHRIDEDHLFKELGDVCWMIAEICTASGFKMSDVMYANILKLKARYPDGFEAEKSLYRQAGDI